MIDAATERYTLDVASAMAGVLGSQLAGVYLVVCDGPATAVFGPEAGDLIAAQLAAELSWATPHQAGSRRRQAVRPAGIGSSRRLDKTLE